MRRMLAVLMAVSILGAAAAPAAAQEGPPTLAAAGVGQAFLVPDQAELFVSINRAAKTSRRARGIVNRRLARVRRAVSEQGIADEDVQTAGVSVFRDRIRIRGTRRSRTVYRASSSLTVLSRDIDGLGRLIDALANAGADDLEGPDFSHSDPSQGRIVATRRALADARRRADDAAAQTGHRITGVQSIDLDPFTESFFGGDDSEGGGGGRLESGTEIEPGRLRFGALVRVVYAIEPAA